MQPRTIDEFDLSLKLLNRAFQAMRDTENGCDDLRVKLEPRSALRQLKRAEVREELLFLMKHAVPV